MTYQPIFKVVGRDKVGGLYFAFYVFELPSALLSLVLNRLLDSFDHGADIGETFQSALQIITLEEAQRNEKLRRLKYLGSFLFIQSQW